MLVTNVDVALADVDSDAPGGDYTGEKSAVYELICASERDIRAKGGGVILFVPGEGFSMAVHHCEHEERPAQQWEAALLGMMLNAMSSLSFCQKMVEDAERAALAAEEDHE